MNRNVFAIRALHTTLPNLLRRLGKRDNPGISYQERALESHEDVEDDFADFESDFMNVHKSHKQHEIELEERRELTRRLLVKQKYFNEKLPNFLTYAEKEQMKLLNSREPEEWTAEKLAESFPATVDVVAKILRANWRARSAKRARQHDEAVIKNWELLRSGEFPTLPPELKEHLRKFTDRTRSDVLQNVYSDSQLKPQLPQPSTQEFSSIITSCKKYKEPEAEKQLPLLKTNKFQKTTSVQPRSPNDSEETYLLEKIKDKRQMRLQDLKQKVKLDSSPLNQPANASLEQIAANAFANPSGTGVLPKEREQPNEATYMSDSGIIERFQSNEIVIGQEDRKRYEMTVVKDRIYIPKKLRRKGATYKVEDCYYDNDGEFLYRVPGITK